MDQLAECVRAGKARFRGISSHDPPVLRAGILSGLCDVVLFAVGPYCDARYIEEILPLARSRRVGTVCFKTFGAGKLLGDTAGYGRPLEAGPRGRPKGAPVDKPPVPPAVEPRAPALPRLSVEECVSYTLTCDPDVALLGLSFPHEQDAAFRAAREFRPLSPGEMAAVRRRAAEAVRGKGPCWWDPQP
jgi:hypothetical protein